MYAPATEEYKEFLKYANKLYSEGLLDPEFSTQTAQQWQAKVKADQCGIYSGSPHHAGPLHHRAAAQPAAAHQRHQ